MKNNGIVRPVDNLGRIVIPIEIRNELNIKGHDPVDIIRDGDQLILKKHQAGCLFCGNKENLVEFKDFLICPNCLAELKAK